jgi:hypothetical protein
MKAYYFYMRFLLVFFVLIMLSAQGLLSEAANKADLKVEFIGVIQNQNTQGIKGTIKIWNATKSAALSTVKIVLDNVTPDLEQELDRGDVLEAWLLDHGDSSVQYSNLSSIHDDDNESVLNNEASRSAYTVKNSSGLDVNIGEIPFINLMEAIPYTLSMGLFKKQKNGKYTLEFRTRNLLSPYDQLLITLEPNGNQGNYDPRPGTQVAITNLGKF